MIDESVRLERVGLGRKGFGYGIRRWDLDIWEEEHGLGIGEGMKGIGYLIYGKRNTD